jgi:pseudouridine-5'-monophosphatase
MCNRFQQILFIFKTLGIKEYTKELQEKVLGMEVARGIEVIIKETKIPITVQEFMVMEREIYCEEMKNVNLMPGVIRLVKHFHDKNIPMAIATGSTIESFAMKITKFPAFFKIGNFFSHIVFTRDDPEVKRPKPFPDVYIVTANRFTEPVDPKQCLVFEDSNLGVDGAIAAGMQCVMVPDNRFKCTQKNATLILPSLLDFKPELFGLPAFDEAE